MMIDNRHRQGDTFKYTGDLVFEAPSNFDPALLVIAATVSKSHGGIQLSELDVVVGEPSVIGDVTTVAVAIEAGHDVTKDWPPGPLTMSVVITYEGFRQTCRPVNLVVIGKDIL